MRRFNSSLLFLQGAFYFGRKHFDQTGRDASAPFPGDDESKSNAISVYKDMYEECAKAGLRASAATALGLVGQLEGNTTLGAIVDLQQELSRRISDELNCEYFIQLSNAEALRFEEWRRGWESILQRFPDVTRDVEETNKCFALNRYTAAMFHALHVAEWGAIKLGEHIGVMDPKKGWGPTEKKLRALIDSGHSGLPGNLAGQFEFLEQMNREINSMVLAWRHKVDHAANHLAILPNTDFTPDVAEHIISAVRIFMLRLIEGTPNSA